MRGIFKRANALIVVTVFCSPSLAADGKSFHTVSGEEKLSAEPKPGKAAQLDRLFPDELKYWPDLKRVDKLLNRKPFQTFTSLESLAWLDGGKTLMVGDRSGFAVWDVASQRLVRRLPTKARNGGIARVSRDGKRFLTTGDSTKTQVLDWPTLKITQSIDARAGKDGKSGELALVEISPDGKYMAAIVGFTRKSFMRIFNCDTGEMLLDQVTDREICSMAWDPRNRFVVLGESRGTVIFRSLKGELIRRGIRLEPADKPRSLSMSPDGLRLAIGAEKYVGVYAISGRRKLWEQKADDFERFDHLMKLRFSSDGKEVVGLGYTAHDKTALVAWDAETGKEKRSRVVSSYYTSEMEVSPDGKLIAVEGWNQTLALCDARTFKPLVVSELAGDRSIVNCHNFPSGIYPSPDGKRFLLIGWSAVMMWDVELGRELWTVTRPQAVHAASWSSSGKWFAFTRDGVSDDVMETASLEVIAAEDGHVMRRLRLEDAKGGPVLVLSDDRLVVCSQNHVLLFDTEGREIWKTHLGGGNKNVAVAVSEDETKIGMVRLGEEFSEYSHGRVALLDLSTGKHLRDLRSVTTPYRVVFSPDGKQLYATAYGTPRARGDVQVLLEQWDVATGVRVNNPHVPDDPKHGEDYVSVYPDHLSRAIIDRSPLLATSYSSTSARLGVSPDGSWLVFEKPFASGEREENGIPKWSKRLLLWDLVNSKSLGEITLPGWIRDVAVLKDDRLVILNQNGTVFVMRRPDAHVKDIPKPEREDPLLLQATLPDRRVP